jgi:DNA-binding transcriptional regulator YdaS (Cro superfamily)
VAHAAIAVVSELRNFFALTSVARCATLNHMSTPNLQALLAEKGLRLIDLSRMLGVNKATVTRWSQGAVPAENVLTVERATGIPREKIRPDIYPPEDVLPFRADGQSESPAGPALPQTHEAQTSEEVSAP